jgi:hypothetical protein
MIMKIYFTFIIISCLFYSCHKKNNEQVEKPWQPEVREGGKKIFFPKDCKTLSFC